MLTPVPDPPRPRAVALLLLVAAAFAALWVSAASAAPGDGSFNVDPQSGDAGVTITALGAGWASAQQAELFLADPTPGGVTPIATVPINGGSFSASVTIPEGSTGSVAIWVKVSGPNLPTPSIRKAVYTVAGPETTSTTVGETTSTTAPTTTSESTTTTASTTTSTTTTTIGDVPTSLRAVASLPPDDSGPEPPREAARPGAADEGVDALLLAGIIGLLLAVAVGVVEIVSTSKGNPLRVPVAATAAGFGIVALGAIVLSSASDTELRVAKLRATTVQKTQTIAPGGAVTNVAASCAAGERVLGGGYSSDWTSTVPAPVPPYDPATAPSKKWALADPSDPTRVFTDGELTARYEADFPWWWANQQDLVSSQITGSDTQLGPRVLTSAPRADGTGWEVSLHYGESGGPSKPVQLTVFARCAKATDDAGSDGMPKGSSVLVPTGGKGLGYCAEGTRLTGPGWRAGGRTQVNPRAHIPNPATNSVIVDTYYQDSTAGDPAGVCVTAGGDVDLKTKLVTADFQVTTGTEGEATVACPSGYDVVGGGWDSGFRGNARRATGDPYGEGTKGLGTSTKDLVPIASAPTKNGWRVRIRSAWLDVVDWESPAPAAAAAGRPQLIDQTYARTYGRRWQVARAADYTRSPYHSVRVMAVCARRP